MLMFVCVCGLGTYDFSTLYTTLPHNLIKDQLNELIRKTFATENTRYLACNNDKAFLQTTYYLDILLELAVKFVKHFNFY